MMRGEAISHFSTPSLNGTDHPFWTDPWLRESDYAKSTAYIHHGATLVTPSGLLLSDPVFL
jgi:hypothetical protein